MIGYAKHFRNKNKDKDKKINIKENGYFKQCK